MEWINVKDRLPEEFVTVWVTDGEFVNLGSYISDGDAFSWGVDTETYLEDGQIKAWDCELISLEPTHWMQLPKFELKNN
jgi:hypothetical protein